MLRLLLTAWLAWIGAGAWALAEVAAYPIPQGVPASADYRAKAGGQDVFVYQTPAFSLTAFAFTGEAEVVVEVLRPIQHAVVRPRSRGIEATVRGNTLSFRISRPGQFAIEVDDDLRRPLFVFANAPEARAPQRNDPHVHYFEGGRIHEAGRIEVKDHDTIYLAGGAVVRGTIRANHASDIRILGPGMLDGSTRNKQVQSVMLNGCRDVTIDGPIVLGGYGWSVVSRLSENVRLNNVKVVSWRENDDGFDPDSSRHVTVENCFFRTKDDCIAVKAHARFGDDKTTSANSPESFNTDDVRVTKSTFWSSEWGHALTVGFAVSAPAIRNVVFQDCDIIKKERGPALSIDNHDLGLVENVRFEDIRIEDGCDKLFALKVAFSEYSADCPREFFRNNPARKPASGAEWEGILREKRGGPRGTIRNVIFKDIQIAGERLPDSDIRGFSKASEVSDVLLQNITFRGKPLKSAAEAAVTIRNATNVRFAE